MIELTAVVTLPRGDDVKWDDREYREGVLLQLAEQMVRSIRDRITVRRIKDVGTKSTKIEARLLIWERESAVGGSMPLTLADAIEQAGEARLMPEKKKIVKPGAPLIEVAMRVITMPDKKETGQ